MVNQNRQVLCSKLVALSLALWLATVSGVATAQILHRFGQSIQPIFEGFEKNPDGSFTMWFGYLNRDGTRSTDLKGNHWKGPFPLPRMQWYVAGLAPTAE